MYELLFAGASPGRRVVWKSKEKARAYRKAQEVALLDSPAPTTNTTHETEGSDVPAVQAYILIQTEVGKAAQVAREVRDIDGVDAAEDVTGPYDVIVRASASNVDDLGKLVVAKIQAVEGITRTLTCPVVHL
jgi:DNA-binding Lrp family transcriptional regulator